MAVRRKKVKRKASWKGYDVETCGQTKTKTYPTITAARQAAKSKPEAVIRARSTGHFVNKEPGAKLETPAPKAACPVPKACPAPKPCPDKKRAPTPKSKDKVGGLVGQQTTVLTVSGACLAHEPARYRLTAIDKLKPSHSGLTFKKSPGYPEGTQERRYSTDRSEQQKVIANSQAGCFAPAVVANTDPTPLGGPPIVTSSGIVLGGNSRAMVLQRVWSEPDGQAAKEYRDYLSRHAPCWGFDAADVAVLKKPVLVRVVATKDLGGTKKSAVRRYNEALTQELDTTSAQVATSARIDSGILAELEKMGEEETLTAFLGSRQSSGLVRLLQQKDVITRTQTNRYIGKNGLLNEDGQRFFARALVGRVLPDADALDLLFTATPSLRPNLARAVPYLLRAGEVGKKWDVSSAMPDAARLYSAVKASGSPLPVYLRQASLFDGGIKLSTATVLLTQILLDRPGPQQLAGGFRRFAASARASLTRDMFSEPAPPVSALAEAFRLKTIAAPSVQVVSDFAEKATPRVAQKPSEQKKTPKAKQAPPLPAPPLPAPPHVPEKDLLRSCHLEELEKKAGWRMFWVDLRSGNGTYDRRECMPSKDMLRWVVTGVVRHGGDGLLHALYWYPTKREASAKLKELRTEHGKPWPYEGAGPDHIRLRLRQVQKAKNGDARTAARDVTPAKPT